MPTNAAVLLFGKEPRCFFNNIQVHCLHFAGTEKRKPILSQQPYEGRLFEVIVFADRIEVWNPGQLPTGLTPELLREPHGPLPHNPLIAEPLFRVKYVEKAGTDTTDMIDDCIEAGLPEPDFKQHGPHFVTTIWRDWLTDKVLGDLGLNERQVKVIQFLKAETQIANAEYQTLTDVSRATAKRDLDEMVKLKLINLIGSGRTAHYRLAEKRLIIDPNGSSEHEV